MARRTQSSTPPDTPPRCGVSTPVADNAVYVGEAKGAWIWAILWPSAAGVLLLENLALEDLVERTEVSPGHLGLDIPHGALMPRLAELTAAGGGQRR